MYFKWTCNWYIKIKKKLYQFCCKYEVLHMLYEFLHELKNVLRQKGALENIRYMIDDERKLAYLLSSKVACSSISASMYGGEVADNDSIHRLNLTKSRLKSSQKVYYKFAFVRNTFERLVSCYESKYVNDIKNIGITREWLDFDYYLFGYLRNPVDFTDFIHRICKIPSNLAEDHFVEQYSHLHDRKGNCLVDYIGKYENLENDFEPIRKKYNLKPLPHFNQSNKGNWMDYYTLETAELVWKKYKKDICTYGYEDEYHRLIQYLCQKEKDTSINKGQ